MVKNIILHVDKVFFYKMQEDKLRREKILGSKITWEIYIALLFGISKYGGKTCNDK